MNIKSISDVETMVYSSFMEKKDYILAGDDAFTRKPEFTRILLDKVGESDRKQKNILVTGSKGKGSLSIMLATILESQGLKVGLFTSPHLINYKERIRINGVAIDDESLIYHAKKVLPFIEEVKQDLAKREYIGPVGISAVIASLYFESEKTDVNIFELGRGARFDDVNMIEGIYAGINRVFVEHKGNLGHTLEEVAYHKSGIIKKGIKKVFSSKQDFLVARNFNYQAFSLNIPVNYYGDEYRAEIINRDKTGIEVNVIIGEDFYNNLKLPLLGDFQAENLALALALAKEYLENYNNEKVNNHKIIIDRNGLRTYLMNMILHGRMELIEDNDNSYVLDGCISSISFKMVIDYLKSIGFKTFNILLAIPDDKEYQNILKLSDEITDNIIFLKVSNHHLRFGEEQKKKITAAGYEYFEDIKSAMEYMKGFRKADLNLLLGTQSLIIDVKQYFEMDTLNIK